MSFNTREIPLASTIILMREASASAPEILMAQRSKTASFMPGAYVFPGGRVDGADGAETLAARCHWQGPGGAAAAPEIGGLDRQVSTALRVAAIRELFEEAGVLLAVNADGQLVDLTASARAERFQKWREDLCAGQAQFGAFLEAEDLYLPLYALAPFSHWVTPIEERKRFDTYFFIARYPGGQNWGHDNAEVIDSRWISAPEALKAHQDGGFLLVPPTFRTLEILAPFLSVDGIFEQSPTFSLAPIMPTLRRDGGVKLLLPGDPDYPHDYKEAVQGGTRIVLTDTGTWRSMGAGAPEDG